MAKAKTDLNWIEVETGEFTGKLKSTYGELKQAQSLVNDKRKAFEAEFVAAASKAEVFDPKSEELVMSYRFGKLSVAARPAGQTASRSSKPTLKIG